MAAIASSTPPIPAGEHVQVSLPHIGLLPATVESADPGAVVVVLAVGDDRVQAPRRRRGRGRARDRPRHQPLRRHAASSTTAGPSSSASSCQGDAERIQRREWARVEATLPVTVKGIDEPVGGDTVTLNISGGGVLVKDPWNMPLGIDVRIELEVEAGARIQALGRVVREPAPDQKGIRIDSHRPRRLRAPRAPRPRARARRPAHVEGPMRGKASFALRVRFANIAGRSSHG